MIERNWYSSRLPSTAIVRPRRASRLVGWRIMIGVRFTPMAPGDALRALTISRGRPFVPGMATRVALVTGASRGIGGEAVEALGRLDVLVNNGGVYERALLDDTSPKAWDRRLAVNLHGAFYMAKAAVPEMKKAGGGRIVNVSTQLAFRGTSHGADYVAAKAGLVGLTRALALEFARDSILVNAVAPGAIETDILASDTPEDRARRIRTIPLGRVGRPEEVAAAIAFLVGPGGDYITGQVLHVNGGSLMT